MTTHDFGHNFARSRRSRVPSWPTTHIPQEPQTNFPQTTNHKQPLLVLPLCPLTSLFFFFEPSSADLIIRQRPWPHSTLRYYDVSRTSKAGRVEGRGRWSARTTLLYGDVRGLRTTHHQCPWRHYREGGVDGRAYTHYLIRLLLSIEFHHVSHRISIFSFRVPEDSWRIIDLLHLNFWTLQTHASSLHFFSIRD